MTPRERILEQTTIIRKQYDNVLTDPDEWETYEAQIYQALDKIDEVANEMN